MLWRIAFVSLVLGLSWALRGHFGHEHGAAWAGSLGCMAAILVSGRRDWLNRLPAAASLGGIGWGVGGMMSYGIVVGYGRGTDFLNVWYGLAMLTLIGGLYGFIGGGFLGLSLESTRECPARWSLLAAEMAAGGVLGWGVLISQFGWLMTPPRSELWAACLGAAVFLGWHLCREGFVRSFRLALFTAAGAGLGFALGNFFQTAGTASGIGFNWWNVMEFTLGCCGGLGLAIGLLSSRWPGSAEPSSAGRILSWVFLLGALPLINYVQSFGTSRLAEQARLFAEEGADQIVGSQQWAGGGIVAVLLTLSVLVASRSTRSEREAALLFWSSLLGFLLMSHVCKAVFWAGFAGQVEQAIYWLILAAAILVYLASRQTPLMVTNRVGLASREVWLLIFLVILIPLVLAAFSVQLHDGLPGAHQRF